MYIRGLLVRANLNPGTPDDNGRLRESTYWLDIEGLSVMCDLAQYEDIAPGQRVEVEVLLRSGKSGRSYAKALTPVRIFENFNGGEPGVNGKGKGKS